MGLRHKPHQIFILLNAFFPLRKTNEKRKTRPTALQHVHMISNVLSVKEAPIHDRNFTKSSSHITFKSFAETELRQSLSDFNFENLFKKNTHQNRMSVIFAYFKILHKSILFHA